MVTLNGLLNKIDPAPTSAPTEDINAPKLCINCKHIATNSSGSWESYRCMAPQNSFTINLVTGYKEFINPLCVTQRRGLPDLHYCSKEGNWYEYYPHKKWQDIPIQPVNRAPAPPKSSRRVNDSLADEL